MNIIELLKQLKTIHPRKEFTEISRATILQSVTHSFIPGDEDKPTLSLRLARFRAILFKNMEMAVALAGATILVTFVIKGASLFNVSPVQLTGLEPISLHAEAEAVDIQIQLARFAYQESLTDSTKRAARESTVPIQIMITASQSETSNSSEDAEDIITTQEQNAPQIVTEIQTSNNPSHNQDPADAPPSLNVQIEDAIRFLSE